MRNRDRRRNKSSGEDGNEIAEPMDKREQEKLVKKLNEEAEKVAGNARRMFSIVFTVVTALMLLLFARSVTTKTLGFIHERFFIDDVPAWGFSITYLFSVICFSLSAYIVKYGDSETNKRTMIVIFLLDAILGLLTAVYWGPVFILRWKSIPWPFYWLPFANIAGMLLAVYVDRDAKVLIRDAVVMGLLEYEYQEI